MSFDIRDFHEGNRVELHPATDRWMMGDRIGTVKKVGRKVLHIHMDVSGRTIRVAPFNVGSVIYRDGTKAHG